MTSDGEEGFWAALEADPSDFTTRLVFSDWLQDRGDERAEGFRALAEGRYRPKTTDWYHTYFGRASNCHVAMWKRDGDRVIHALLPDDWWEEIVGDPNLHQDEWWKYWRTAREAENAAALAFTKLPAERRAELLSGSVVLAGAG